MFITFKHKALKEYKDTLLKDSVKDIIIITEPEVLKTRNTHLQINYPPVIR